MKNYSNNNKVIIVIIVWFIYSLILSFGGSVGWWPEKHSDGWYRMYEKCEGDEYGETCWDVVIDGPFSKIDIDRMLREDQRASDEFMKKYGTIYNLVPKTSPNDSFIIAILKLLVYLSVFCGVPYLIYQVFYEKRAK